MYALLASHPHISMVRRTNMWRWFYGQFGDLAEPKNFERCLQTMLRYKRLDTLRPDPDRIRSEFYQGPATYGHLFALFHRHHAQRRKKTRWGDKSLHTEHFAAQIVAEFREARIIHMIRDPRDRYASVLKRYDDNEKGIAAAMGRWLASTWQARANLRRYPQNVIVLRYETLAQNPEDTLRKVCAFVGEPYVPEMLSMRGAPDHAESGGNSSFTRFAPGTISTRSIGRYRKVLSPQDIAFIQLCASREMHQFDYAKDTLLLSRGERLHFYGRNLPLTLLRLAGWLAAERITSVRGTTAPESRLRPMPQPANQ